MSWKKKKKEINRAKHKVKLIIGLMFAVVLGLVIILGFKIINQDDYFKVESRIDELKKTEIYKDSKYEKIGWLRIQGTEVDVPVLYTDASDSNYPVELEGFVWTSNTSKEFKRQINISGHNIFNLSAKPKIKSNDFHRLEQLMAFMYYDFAKDNEYIQLTWDNKDYVFKIFSVGFINKTDASFIVSYEDATNEEIKTEENIIKKYSFYDYDVDVNENDKIITLTTCTRFYGVDSNVEFFVVGRLLRDNEKIRHYKVTKNSNYNEIEKKLKGDEK